MADYGLLVDSWPLVPGCDASGIVIKAGNHAKSPLGGLFKPGDKVCGCTRLGVAGYSPWQELVRFLPTMFNTYICDV
jgi:NADPH:quinone reductase-like Zn-dependent oxidoreductase